MLTKFLNNFLNNLRYRLESFCVKFGLWFFSQLSFTTASSLAGRIALFVGKKIKVNDLAKKNLALALPELDEKKRAKIIDEMWDNLGRIVGEFVHVCKKNPEEILKIVDIDPVSKINLQQLKEKNKGAIIFSAHIGNWEIGPKILLALGFKVNVVYRPLNNPYVEEMTAKIRAVNLIEKGNSGSRKIIEALKNNELVIILADQKISEGEKIKFFHEDAITTTSIARLALKYDVDLIPARVIRFDQKSNFFVEVEKPLVIKKTLNLNEDILALTLAINQNIERWIRNSPAQWFWVHNRWKK